MSGRLDQQQAVLGATAARHATQGVDFCMWHLCKYSISTSTQHDHLCGIEHVAPHPQVVFTTVAIVADIMARDLRPELDTLVLAAAAQKSAAA
jgi:hypothetical protein